MQIEPFDLGFHPGSKMYREVNRTYLHGLPLLQPLVFRHELAQEDGFLYSKEVIQEACERFNQSLFKVATQCIGGEAFRSLRSLREIKGANFTEIDDENVSHVVEALEATSEGVVAKIRVINTPRGDVVAGWMLMDQQNKLNWFLRRELEFSMGRITRVKIITVDVLLSSTC